MRYYVQHPIYLDCSLRCGYCFHSKEFGLGDLGGPGHTIEQYIRWRDTHLVDAEDIIMHLHGGEPSTPLNVAYICRLLHQATVERIDILTNGLGEWDNYHRLLQFADRFHRIGCTYHRKQMGKSKHLRARFEDTVFRLRDAGVPLYVKELLFTDMRDEIVEAKKYWQSRGIEFKVQDFKGSVRGEDFSEFERYTSADIDMVDEEYVHTGRTCCCVKGYKNVIIRGGWMAGDVLACWIDPTVIGNIQQNTFNPNYRIVLKEKEGRLDVEGVPKLYRGTYGRDRFYEAKKEDTDMAEPQNGQPAVPTQPQQQHVSMDALKAAILSGLTETSGSILFLCEQFRKLEAESNERGRLVQNLVAENEKLKARIAELEQPPGPVEKEAKANEPTQ